MRALAVVGTVVLVGALVGGGIYLVKNHAEPASANNGGGDSSTPISQRAMNAYNVGDYAAAVPLLKQWAETMKANDPQTQQTMGKVLVMLEDAKQKLAGAAVGPVASAPATGPAVASAGTPTAAGAPVAFVDTGDITIDPSTGKTRTPHPAYKPGETLQMTIKEMGNFEFDATKDADVPADVKALSGAKVKLRGFMIPMTQADTITEFAFVPSLVGCCFGQPPGVQHTITCKAPAGKAVQYTVDEIWVTGKLNVNVQRDDGYTYSIFTVDVDSVTTVE